MDKKVKKLESKWLKKNHIKSDTGSQLEWVVRGGYVYAECIHTFSSEILMEGKT